MAKRRNSKSSTLSSFHIALPLFLMKTIHNETTKFVNNKKSNNNLNTQKKGKREEDTLYEFEVFKT